MDRLLEKLPGMITTACEQALVAIVLACFVIAFALLTIPDSISSFTSLCDLAWDQLSAPSPHAPAGDLTFRLIKIWTNHVVDLEFPKLIRAGASEDAAVIAAAHRVLVNYFPVQASLDTQFSSSIGSLSDTPANPAAGEAVGEAAAQALIVARTGDGLLGAVPYTPPLGTGFSQPTPPAFAPAQTPWLGQMVPFTMTSADQFSPGGHDPLTSKNWIADYNEVMALGSLSSTIGTAQQTEIGLFWAEHTGQQYARAFRALAAQKGLDTADTARLLAMLWTGTADALDVSTPSILSASGVRSLQSRFVTLI